MLTNEYLKRVYDGLAKRNANEPEFLQAVREVLESIQPVVEKHPFRANPLLASNFNVRRPTFVELPSIRLPSQSSSVFNVYR